MKDIHFRVWHVKEKKMYFRGYQKWFWVLLCEDDQGENQGQGRPVKRAYYGDCVFLESTGLFDRSGREIFEADILRVLYKGQEFEGEVPPPPDTFGAGRIHPLKELLAKNGIHEYPISMELEILGNRFERRQ